jgi:hypothetical protein
MSYAVEPLKTVNVLEPRTRLYSERVYAILKGGRQVSWQQVTATSNLSTTQIVFNAPPPSAGFIVDRKFLVRVMVQGVFAGTSGGGPLLQLGTNDGFRQFPLNFCTAVTTITLNNSTFSVNTSEVLPALLTMNGPKQDYDLEYSTAPSMPDSYQNYGDWTTYGSAKNPLALYGENSSQIPRGGFPINVISNTSSAATIQAVITESLYDSPIKFGPGLESGFIGITNVTVALTMNPLQRMWSSANTTLSGPPVFTFYQSPQMLFTYITPQLVPAVPKQIMYPYYKVEYILTPGPTLSPGQSASISGTSIQWPSIPKAAIIFAAITQSQRSYLTSDSWAAINSVTINFNNMSSLLASATQQDLYKISVGNGSQLPWGAWSQYRGSVLPIMFGKDIGLDAIEAPGLGGQYQFQPTVNITNVNLTQTFQYDLYVVYIQEGICTIAEGNCIPQIGVISPLDIASSVNSPFMDYKEAERMWGGSDFFGSLRSYLGRFVEGVQKAVPYVEKALPYVKKYGPSIAKALIGVGKGKKRKDVDPSEEENALNTSREELNYDEAIDRLGDEIKEVAAYDSQPSVTMSRLQMLNRE